MLSMKFNMCRTDKEDLNVWRGENKLCGVYYDMGG